MKILTFGNSTASNMDINGTISIYYENEQIVFRMSLAELLAINSKACRIVANNELLPEDFLDRIQKEIQITDAPNDFD